MKRRIPLHKPQNFPPDWEARFLTSDTIPTEEQLCRRDHMDDEIYNEWKLQINTKALVYAAMQALNATSVTPNIISKSIGSFNRVFLISFPSTKDTPEFRVAARVLRGKGRMPGRIEATAAIMSLALARGLLVPEVYAWHPGTDNPVGAPYILLEWAKGEDIWRSWIYYTKEEKVNFLEEIARHHAKLAEPLPFVGIGNVRFANAEAGHDLPPDKMDSYRVGGPFLPGPLCTQDSRSAIWPQTIPTSLRDFWVAIWQHEVDFITSKHGADRSVIITDDEDETPATLGELLEVAASVRVLIDKCVLPSPNDYPSVYEPCFVPTDYAFRNMIMDPKTCKITALIDWDDVYIMPFLLCSRYPEEICFSDGVDEDRWDKSGRFPFLPLDEEGEVPEEDESIGIAAPNGPPTAERGCNRSEENQGSEDRGTVETAVCPASHAEDDKDGGSDAETGKDEENIPAMLDADEVDFHRRVRETRLRREYEKLLASADARFASDGFWQMREDPLKIQHLVMSGWAEWLLYASWIQERAIEMKLAI
ncbi:hypothetical protein NLJ89_g9626 [Agrocybe chaxingu]|uniref:Aminoglycoside phosphotransferase domain-containing protein n=1 Tax=Agrocybe chaxingu TaxID=84603 RepID=A0A9W8MRN1_9AGAR|nr:hypothetical protein NLJ89_g9626 [Agrocybe chaxingu]